MDDEAQPPSDPFKGIVRQLSGKPLGSGGGSGGGSDAGGDEPPFRPIREPSAEAQVLASTLRERHGFPFPIRPSQVGSLHKPASATMGFSTDVATQAFVALRLSAEFGENRRIVWWQKRAVDWARDELRLDDAQRPRLALEALARLADEEADPESGAKLRDRVLALLDPACPPLSREAETLLEGAIQLIRNEFEDPGVEGLLPFTGRVTPSLSSAARAWLKLLLYSGSSVAPKRGSSLFRLAARSWESVRPPEFKIRRPIEDTMAEAAQVIGLGPSWMNAAFGEEIVHWSVCLGANLYRNHHPSRHKLKTVTRLAPPGSAANDVADEPRMWPVLLACADADPQFARELLARAFIRVLAGEYLINFAAFNSRSKALVEPLLAVLAHAQHDEECGAEAAELIDTLKMFTIFGGHVPLKQSFRSRAKDRLQAGLSCTGWIDAFDVSRSRSRVAALRTVDTASAFIGRLERIRRLGLLVADALRDFHFLTRWSELGIQGPPPDFIAWGERVQKKRHGVPDVRLEDSEILSGICSRMSDPAFVNRVRAVRSELDAWRPTPLFVPDTPTGEA